MLVFGGKLNMEDKMLQLSVNVDYNLWLMIMIQENTVLLLRFLKIEK